jgi:hypothetical protein
MKSLQQEKAGIGLYDYQDGFSIAIPSRTPKEVQAEDLMEKQRMSRSYSYLFFAV